MALFRSYQSDELSDDQGINHDIQLADLGIEVELDTKSFYVSKEVPKRVGKRLVRQANKTVCGWGLWIEEEFIIPWQIMLQLMFYHWYYFGLASLNHPSMD